MGRMNTKFFEVAAVIGAVLAAAPALADEAPAVAKPVRHVERAAASVRAAPAAAQPSWTGAQGGGQGGVSNMAQGFAEPGARLFPSSCPFAPTGYCSETPFSFSGNRTGATGGGFLGYRMQFGTFVGGVEGDINAQSMSNSYASSDSNAFRSETFNGSVKQGWDSSIRGRAGFLVTPWTLVYGTGGVAFGSVSGSFGYSAYEVDHLCGFVCASSVGAGSWSTTRSGLTGGAGIETLITQSLTLRLEYRYTDFGRYSENVYLNTVCGTTCSSPSNNALINLHPTFQAVRVGVGYNF
jgi:outer membrane immunogenic protein